jgi:hypothetical protein
VWYLSQPERRKKSRSLYAVPYNPFPSRVIPQHPSHRRALKEKLGRLIAMHRASNPRPIRPGSRPGSTAATRYKFSRKSRVRSTTGAHGCSTRVPNFFFRFALLNVLQCLLERGVQVCIVAEIEVDPKRVYGEAVAIDVFEATQNVLACRCLGVDLAGNVV